MATYSKSELDSIIATLEARVADPNTPSEQKAAFRQTLNMLRSEAQTVGQLAATRTPENPGGEGMSFAPPQSEKEKLAYRIQQMMGYMSDDAIAKVLIQERMAKREAKLAKFDEQMGGAHAHFPAKSAVPPQPSPLPAPAPKPPMERPDEAAMMEEAAVTGKSALYQDPRYTRGYGRGTRTPDKPAFEGPLMSPPPPVPAGEVLADFGKTLAEGFVDMFTGIGRMEGAGAPDPGYARGALDEMASNRIPIPGTNLGIDPLQPALTISGLRMAGAAARTAGPLAMWGLQKTPGLTKLLQASPFARKIMSNILGSTFLWEKVIPVTGHTAGFATPYAAEAGIEAMDDVSMEIWYEEGRNATANEMLAASSRAAMETYATFAAMEIGVRGLLIPVVKGGAKATSAIWKQVEKRGSLVLSKVDEVLLRWREKGRPVGDKELGAVYSVVGQEMMDELRKQIGPEAFEVLRKQAFTEEGIAELRKVIGAQAGTISEAIIEGMKNWQGEAGAQLGKRILEEAGTARRRVGSDLLSERLWNALSSPHGKSAIGDFFIAGVEKDKFVVVNTKTGRRLTTTRTLQEGENAAQRAMEAMKPKPDKPVKERTAETIKEEIATWTAKMEKASKGKQTPQKKYVIEQAGRVIDRAFAELERLAKRDAQAVADAEWEMLAEKVKSGRATKAERARYKRTVAENEASAKAAQEEVAALKAEKEAAAYKKGRERVVANLERAKATDQPLSKEARLERLKAASARREGARQTLEEKAAKETEDALDNLAVGGEAEVAERALTSALDDSVENSVSERLADPLRKRGVRPFFGEGPLTAPAEDPNIVGLRAAMKTVEELTTKGELTKEEGGILSKAGKEVERLVTRLKEGGMTDKQIKAALTPKSVPSPSKRGGFGFLETRRMLQDAGLDLHVSGLGREPAPATWKGWQEWPKQSKPALDLYDLTADIPGHPAGSTISGKTLREKGFDISGIKRPAPPYGEPNPTGVTYTIKGPDGSEIATFTNGKDALKAAKRLLPTLTNRPGMFLSGEAINNTILAEDPDDDEATAKQKAAIRTMIRLGTMGSFAAMVAMRGRGGHSGPKFSEGLKAVKDTFLHGMPDHVLESKNWMNAVEATRKLRNGLAQVWLPLRSTPEIVRNMDPAIRDGVMQLTSAGRQVKREMDTLLTRVNTVYNRLGVRASYTMQKFLAEGGWPAQIGDAIVGKGGEFHVKAMEASKDIYNLLSGIHADHFLTMDLTRANKMEIEQAIATSFTQYPDHITASMANKASDAVTRLSKEHLEIAQEITRIYRDLRDKEISAYASKFLKVEGAQKPWQVRNSQTGDFVKRFDSEFAAAKYADKLNKRKANVKKERTFGITNDPNPSAKEFDAALGPTLPNYATRLVYDGIQNEVNVRDLIQKTGEDPVDFFAEMNRILSMPAKQKRGAFERLFGVMEDEEYATLINEQIIPAVGAFNHSRDLKVLGGIPKDIYMRFFKARRHLEPDLFEEDIIKSLNAYIPAALRYINFEQQIPTMSKVIEATKAKVQAGELTPAALDNIESFLSSMLGREKPQSPIMAKFVAKMNSAAYAAALLGRAKPAIDNFIGQTLLVGFPEMKGNLFFSSMIAMADPEIRTALAEHELIKRALPIGDHSLMKAIRGVRDSKTPREAVGALKDAGVTAVDFIGAYSEPPIRTWAMVAGFLKYMEDNRAVMERALNLRPGMTPKELMKAALEVWDSDRLPQGFLDKGMYASEDMVRKVAFFFESETLPPIFRWAKTNPLLGPFSMFINFPVNYGNRLASEIADAFNSRLAPEVRKRALGNILRRTTMTLLVAGPMGLPIIQEMTNEVSDKSPSLGGQLRRALAPVQNAWAQTFGRLSMGRNMARFGYFAPVTELFGNVDRRIADEPAVKLVGDLWTSLGLGGAPYNEYISAKQRLGGALTTTLFNDTPEPESNLLPEPLVLFMHGGRGINDVLNFIVAQRNIDEGLAGPLDPRGGGRPADNPWLRLLWGESEANAASRRDTKYINKEKDAARVRKERFVNAIISPHASEREQQQAMDAFLDNGGAVGMPTTDMYYDAIMKMGTSPEQRAILDLSYDELLMLMDKGFVNKVMPEDIESYPVKEQIRRLNLYLTFMAALGKSTAPSAPTEEDLSQTP